MLGPGFGTHWVKGIVNEKKYHTLFMQPLKNLEIIKTLREKERERERESILRLLHYDLFIN